MADELSQPEAEGDTYLRKSKGRLMGTEHYLARYGDSIRKS